MLSSPRSFRRLFKYSLPAFAVAATLLGCESEPLCTNPYEVCPAANGLAGNFQADPQTFGKLFGECYSDRDCAALGPTATCRLNSSGYSKGSCTVACTDRTECVRGSVHHICGAQSEFATLLGAASPARSDAGSDAGVGLRGNYCQSYCRHPIDCGRRGYTCQILNQQDVDQNQADPIGTCVPVCANDADCGPGSECDEAQSLCVAVGASRTTGGAIGDACTSNNACRSNRCIAATDTSWNGGYCRQPCLIPSGYVSGSQFFDGDELPTANCLDNAVCFPVRDNVAGSPGTCLKRCSGQSDCRSGYTCTKRFASGGTTFPTGVCLPASSGG